LAAIHAIRAAVGDDMELMADFNQGLDLGEALQRCHMIDDEGLAWVEEPIVYDNLDGYAINIPRIPVNEFASIVGLE
jgi:mandelate racemase